MTCIGPPPRATGRVPARVRGQQGAGLLEVLIASAVMAPLILAAALGLLTGMRASANAETTQRLSVAVTTATENLKAMPYLPCGTAEEYQKMYSEWLGERSPAVRESQLSPLPVIQDVTYWDEASTDFVPKCAADGGAQRLAIAVIIDGSIQEATIVTRDPAPLPTLELRR